MQGKRVKTKTICPRCNGTGFARNFNRNQKYSEKTRQKAEVLFDQGLTLREIAKRLKIKHPQTVRNILSKK